MHVLVTKTHHALWSGRGANIVAAYWVRNEGTKNAASGGPSGNEVVPVVDPGVTTGADQSVDGGRVAVISDLLVRRLLRDVVFATHVGSRAQAASAQVEL